MYSDPHTQSPPKNRFKVIKPDNQIDEEDFEERDDLDDNNQ